MTTNTAMIATATNKITMISVMIRKKKLVVCLFAFKVSNKKAYGKNNSVEICARMESFLILYLNYTAL